MKNLEEYDLVALDQSELQEVEGGILFVVGFAVGLAAGIAIGRMLK
ncbi:class IIb bacteriocin, lactobin A/cerein 7B family [Dyadobacter bucti]|jgi:lactobin A/cerein 7B family class IIb bacteriocin|nr:class IIb bacteriocin, lactobin A/cerein 7B family [Dyadobacter bucti]